MGFIDNIMGMTQAISDDNDTYAGADDDFKTPAEIERSNKEAKNKRRSSAGIFGQGKPVVEADAEEKEVSSYVPHQDEESAAAPNLFGSIFGGKKPAVDPRDPAANPNNILLLAPQNLHDMCSLKKYLEANKTVFIRLDNLPAGLDRRILDFASGMAYALGGKLTPISGKTYVATSANVVMVDPGDDKLEFHEDNI